ncbi:MAG: tetratricopeptide repeat protein [Nitrospirae bacterium]|nr:tetratricopeptide repeat protein [Nitrospirota bacterium]
MIDAFRTLSSRGLAAVVWVGVAASGCGSNQKALVHQRVAESYLSERNYTPALEELMKAEKLNPKDAVIQFDMGIAYQGIGRTGEAIEHLKRAVELKKDYAEAHNRLGVIYAGLGRHDSAIQEFQAALSNVLYPAPENVYQNLSYTYYLKHDCDQALAAARNGLRFRPEHSFLLNSMGLALRCVKKNADAEDAFRQSLKLNPDYVEAHFNMGDLLAETGRKESAKVEYQEVIRLAPYSDFARQARSKLELLK